MKNFALLAIAISCVWFALQQKTDTPRESSREVAGTALGDSSSENSLDMPSPRVESPTHREMPNSEYLPNNPDIQKIASTIELFTELPTATDKDWVVETATNSLKAKLVTVDDLPTHLRDLASVRMHTVADRQAQYIDAPPETADESNLEGI